MNDTNRTCMRFLVSLAAVVAAGVAAVMLFVVVVDPYGLYEVLEVSSFNAVKPGLNRYQAEIKQERALRLRPDFVILGNSRAEIGFDPHAAAFSPANGRGFNLAVPGIGLDTSSRQLAELRSAGINAKTVILGVEFIDFLRSASPGAAHAASGPTPAVQTFWRFDTLFSLASVKDAVRTMRIQHDAEASTMASDGFNPLKEYRGYVREEGYYKIFQQRAHENSLTYRRKSTSSLASGDFDYLRAFLLTATQMNADVKLVIYPYHAQILAMFEAAGLWPLFEEWKRQLVAEIVDASRNHPNAKITLLDFSGFGPYNCERIPAQNDMQAATKWYWEAGHFKKELGDIVLDRVMAPAGKGAGDPVFGARLDAATLRTNADRIAAERRACVAEFPELFESARKMLAKVPRAG